MLAAFVGAVHLLLLLAVLVGVMVILLASADELYVQYLLALKRVYALTGIAMILLALAGTTLWFWGAKPSTFYTNNPVFHAKLGLFGLMFLLFVYNGYRVHRLSTQHPADTGTAIALSKNLRRLQKALIPLLIAIPVLAYLMARGIGY
jgi:putative membrane protein